MKFNNKILSILNAQIYWDRIKMPKAESRRKPILHSKAAANPRLSLEVQYCYGDIN